MKPEKTDIIEDIRDVFAFYEAMGIDRFPCRGMDSDVPAHTEERMRKKTTSSPRSLSSSPDDSQSRGRDGLGSDATLDKNGLLNDLRAFIGDCARCGLSQQRKNIVFGEGNPDARIMFIGEAPGREEDARGRPFVGDAGMLLTKMLDKMGLERGDVYIANIIKCRPPMNRDPEADEVGQCMPFIDRQIEIIGPEIIVTLGRIALQSLLHNDRLKITAARGNFLEYKGIPVMPTFHPAYLLRNPRDKWLTWADMQKVLEKLNGS